MSKLNDLWLTLYGNVTFYRLFWTAIQAGAGIVATKWSGDPVFGGLVTALTVVITSTAREKLGGVLSGSVKPVDEGNLDEEL